MSRYRPFLKTDIGKFKVIQRCYKSGAAEPWEINDSVLTREELARLFSFNAEMVSIGAQSSGHLDIVYYQITEDMYRRCVGQLVLPF